MAEPVTERKSQLLLFVVMAMAFFLDGLDGTIVTIALPEIGRQFGMTTGDASWVVTVYFIMMAGLILVFGKIADRGALKKILVTGFVVFAAGSFACGLSGSIVTLLIFRGIQGIGSAMLAATGIMLAVKFIPVSKRNFALSLTVLGSAVGAAFGPVLGGVITEYLSWNWIFYINVPVGILCALFSVMAVPKDGAMDRSRFDYVGSVLLFVMLVCGLYALESLPNKGLTAVSGLALVVFMLMLSWFILYEKRIDYPVLDLSLFRISRFDRATLAFIILNAVSMGMIYLIPFMLSIEMGFDTVTSGLIILVQAVVTLIICLPVGRASDRYGTRWLAVFGCLALVVSSVLFAVTRNGMGIVMAVADLAVFGVVWGFAGGSVGPRLVETAPEDKAGSASSLTSFFVYFGSALGTAMFSALFGIGSGQPGTEISELSPEIFMNGFVFAMIVGAVFAAIAAVLSFSIKKAE